MPKMLRTACMILAAVAMADLSLAQDRTASQQDVDVLANAALPLAKDLLWQYGGFYPFGAAMLPNGQIDVIQGGDIGTMDDEIVANLVKNYRVAVAEGQFKAIAIIGDVMVPRDADSEPVSAVMIQLEHKGGTCVNRYFPYDMTVSGDDPLAPQVSAIEFGESWDTPRAGSVFTTCDAGQPDLDQLQDMLDQMQELAQ